MANNKLKAITTKAKQLYKTGKYKKWTDAIRAASKQIGAVKIIQPGESKNAKPKKVLQQVRNKKTGVFKGYKVVGSVDNKSKLVADLQQEVKDLSNLEKQQTLLRQYMRKTGNPVQDRQIPGYKKQLAYIQRLIAMRKKNISNIKKMI